MTTYTVTLDISQDDVKQLRRELNTVMVIVPTIAGLIETLEHTTGNPARTTVMEDLKNRAKG